MEPPSIPGSNTPQPQPNVSAQPPNSFAAVQPQGTGTAPSRVAFRHGLIFGLIFAGISLTVNLLYKIFPLESTFFLFVLFLVQWALVFPSAYILAGVLASRRTGNVRTGVFASLWITLWYMLSSILLNVLQVALFDGGIPANDNPIFGYVVIIVLSLLLSGVVGTGLGALGGLLGAALKQQQRGATSRKTIGALYLISLALELFSLFLLSVGGRAGTASGAAGVIIVLLLIVLFGIPGIIGWIRALVNLSRAQEWVWFFVVFVFGGIALLFYWITGPEPLHAG